MAVPGTRQLLGWQVGCHSTFYHINDFPPVFILTPLKHVTPLQCSSVLKLFSSLVPKDEGIRFLGCDKLPQLWWPATTEIYYLTVLGLEVWNQGVGWVVLPPEALRLESIPCFFQLLMVPVFLGGLCLAITSLQSVSTVISSPPLSLCIISLCLPLKRTFAVAMRALLHNTG